MRIKQLLLLFLLIPIIGFSQTVYERHTNQVYAYLSIMAQKGYLEWNDLVTPLSKQQILEALTTLELSKNKLTIVEQKDLQFYLKEFSEISLSKYQKFQQDNFKLAFTPIITAGYQNGEAISVANKSVGLNVWGSISKHWGFQLAYQDVNETGTGLDSGAFNLMYGSTTGKMLFRDPNQQKNQNYNELRANISYTFKNGFISIGQDYLNWGYGVNGKLVLSDKAPSYPYIRLHYQPLHWLTFEYSHAWLHSGIVDSNLSYTIPNNVFDSQREVFVNKYMASHSIDFKLKKGVHLSMGESIIYNDQLQIGYLLPIMFFKAYDNIVNRSAIQSGSNGQFFFQLSARNQILSKSHFYSTLFIDEIRISSMLNAEKARNQVGYNIGFSITDFLLPAITVGLEYTKVRPFVYRNFLPAQNYTHHQFPLGEWIGSNADKWIGYIKYTPIAKLKLQLNYQSVRKGEIGTLWQQYYELPQMSFLNGSHDLYKEISFSSIYQILPRLNASAQYIHRYQQPSVANFAIQFGL